MEEKYLECIYCDHEFEQGEIFISFMDEKDYVVISVCAPCQDYYGPDEKKEREGTGWGVMERVGNSYLLRVAHDAVAELVKGNFKKDLTS